jgi:hypothetical protein
MRLGLDFNRPAFRIVFEGVKYAWLNTCLCTFYEKLKIINESQGDKNFADLCRTVLFEIAYSSVWFYKLLINVSIFPPLIYVSVKISVNKRRNLRMNVIDFHPFWIYNIYDQN